MALFMSHTNAFDEFFVPGKLYRNVIPLYVENLTINYGSVLMFCQKRYTHKISYMVGFTMLYDKKVYMFGGEEFRVNRWFERIV